MGYFRVAHFTMPSKTCLHCGAKGAGWYSIDGHSCCYTCYAKLHKMQVRAKTSRGYVPNADETVELRGD